MSLNPIGVVGTGPGGLTVAADAATDKVFVAIEGSDLIAVYHDP